MYSHTADSADVRACSRGSKSLVALRVRSLANGGEHVSGDWGVKGSQIQILSSRREVTGHRAHDPPFWCGPGAGSNRRPSDSQAEMMIFSPPRPASRAAS